MNRSHIPGITLILAGTLIALAPYFLVPVCEGHAPMKCFWTARAALGTGILIIWGGLLYCLCRDAGTRLGIAAMSAGAALLAIAFPSVLIGVCATETMPCHMGTLPALVLAGSLALAISLTACLRCRRAKSRREGPHA